MADKELSCIKIEVINQSDIIYEQIELSIYPVGYDAVRGEILLKTMEIKPYGGHYTYTINYEYGKIPFTTEYITPNDCNLDIMIIATLKMDSDVYYSLLEEYTKILKKQPQIIYPEE